jgi:hypothetical protein
MSLVLARSGIALALVNYSFVANVSAIGGVELFCDKCSLVVSRMKKNNL